MPNAPALVLAVCKVAIIETSYMILPTVYLIVVACVVFVSGSDGNSSEGRNLLRTQFDKKCSLFYVELPGGTILSHAIEENEKFPAQFGREVR